jgi:phosphatidylinositol alpha-1,6-mannosyltransferase
MPVRTVVVYPSLSLSLTPPIGSVDALRKAFNLQGKLVLLTVARLVKRKGIERVLKLLPKLAQEFPNLTYVVLGSGPEQDRLKGIAAGHSLPVLFPGAVKDDFLAAWYLLCDVFILTPEPDPQDVEGFGIVYLEAQAAGKPIVATAVAGVPEAVDGAGVLVQSDAELLQACRRLLSDQLERARLGAHGREHVAQFSPAAQAAKLKNYLYGY